MVGQCIIPSKNVPVYVPRVLMHGASVYRQSSATAAARMPCLARDYDGGACERVDAVS